MERAKTVFCKLQPGQVSARFIVLGSRRVEKSLKPEIWVADETASASLVLSGLGLEDRWLEPGEIFLLKGGEARVSGNHDNRLVIFVSSPSCLARVGFLTMPFVQEPDMSILPYAPACHHKVQEAAPACHHKFQEASVADADAPAERAPEQESGERGVPRCFLCNDEGHQVYECTERARSIVVECPTLDAEASEKRLGMMQVALRDVGLPAAEHLRWYRKTGGRGQMYVRMESDHEAEMVRKNGKVLHIGGERARVFAVLSPKERWKAPDKDSGSKKRPLMALADGSAVAPAAGEVQMKGSSCFLCGSQDHMVTGCPDLLRGACVRCKALDALPGTRKRIAAFKEALEAADLPAADWHKWYGGPARMEQGAMYVRFDTKKDATTFLECKNFEIAGHPAEKYTPGGPASQIKTLKRKAPEKSSKTCFLCGDVGHELPACPIRDRCVLICREWGHQDHETVGHKSPVHKAMVDVLRSAGFDICRAYWHKKVCYLQLESKQHADRLLASKGQAGISLGSETVQVRPARSTRTQAKHAVAGGKADAAEVTGKEEAGPVECALCGDAAHTLQSCDHRGRGVVVCCTSLEVAEKCEAELLEVVIGYEIAAPTSVRLLNDSFYMTLATEAEALSFVERATGEGIELAKTLASAMLATALHKGRRGQIPASRAAGLRPEMRRAVASGGSGLEVQSVVASKEGPTIGCERRRGRRPQRGLPRSAGQAPEEGSG